MSQLNCPKCYSLNVIPAIWGYIEDDEELKKLEEEERIWSGGCIPRDENLNECKDGETANIYCRKCEKLSRIELTYG